MERGFEQHLRAMNELAKERELEMTPEDMSAFEELRTEVIAETAVGTKTSPETQETVYDLQEEKKAVMDRLRYQLAHIDDPSLEEIEELGRTVTYDAETGTYYIFTKGRGQIPITLGEIMTGGVWGQQYRMSESIPRPVRKRFYVNQAREELMDRLDKQIAITEAERSYNKNKKKHTGYEGVAKRTGIPIIEQPPGIIAEHMVSSLMIRLAYDCSLPFVIVRADAHTDVDGKIDFIVHVRDKDQGVSVDASETHKDVGIQFTTRTDTKGIKNKKEQVAEATEKLSVEGGANVERIVVVSIPIDEVKTKVKEWQTNQKENKYALGGPDKLLASDVQEKIFKGVLHEVFSHERIDTMWARVNNDVLQEQLAA